MAQEQRGGSDHHEGVLVRDFVAVRGLVVDSRLGGVGRAVYRQRIDRNSPPRLEDIRECLEPPPRGGVRDASGFLLLRHTTPR